MQSDAPVAFMLLHVSTGTADLQGPVRVWLRNLLRLVPMGPQSEQG